MDLNSITTAKISWADLPEKELKGKTGSTLYKEALSGNTRMRLAEYSAGYESAEWCDKPHLLHCIKGKLTLHLKSGKDVELNSGDSIFLSPADPHTASTGNTSALLFIADDI